MARLHADEVAIETSVVRGLLADQLLGSDHLALTEVKSSGTDNAIYRLGRHLGVRLPRIPGALAQIHQEHRWLERIAPHLSAALPLPLVKGAPGRGYPFSWLLFRWIDGEDMTQTEGADSCALARSIATFVRELESVDPTGAPLAQRRGANLARYDEITRAALEQVRDLIDIGRAMTAWDDALSAQPWPGAAVWLHGDLLPGNIVVRDDQVVGIIDWGAAGVGDPACDAMVGWSMPPEARTVFFGELGFDAATLARARGWVIHQAALFIPYYTQTLPEATAWATQRLAAAVADEVSSR